ncbi:MAG: GTP cyclohydrolase I FolE [Candidatus Latescibacteria bacterium]|nr:GTP cyclohydrolase I FolE [Candidatus Latescibacterota bacterium]
MDLEKIKKGVTLILEGIGEDPEREGLLRTPERVADFYDEFFSGIHKDPQKEIRVFNTKNHDEMIILRDLSFVSMCEHHLLPFFGHAHIAYIPDSNRIVGFSSLVRVIETLAKRPQLQERMTTDIADFIIEAIKPKGIMIVLEAEHMCMTIRGVKKPGSKILTSAIRGMMRQAPSRAEAYNLIMQNH